LLCFLLEDDVLQVSQSLVEILKRRYDLNDVTEATIKAIFQSLNSDKPIDNGMQGKNFYRKNDIFAEKIARDHEELRRQRPFVGLGISDAERLAIVQGLGAQVKNWYKCAQGRKFVFISPNYLNFHFRSNFKFLCLS
jgi:hypothetical protein